MALCNSLVCRIRVASGPLAFGYQLWHVATKIRNQSFLFQAIDPYNRQGSCLGKSDTWGKCENESRDYWEFSELRYGDFKQPVPISVGHNLQAGCGEVAAFG